MQAFDWEKIYASWIPSGKLYFRVLDKVSGKPLGRYGFRAAIRLGINTQHDSSSASATATRPIMARIC